MNRSVSLIDSALQEHGCSIISPWHRYTKDLFGIDNSSIKRKWDNVTKLTNTISHRMQILYQQHIAEILKDTPPIIYIDCTKKWSDDIMFFLLQECIKRSAMENKEEVISDIIWQRTIVTPDSDVRNQYMQEHQLDIDWVLKYYRQQLQIHLDTENKNPTFVRDVLNYEGDMALDGLSACMEHHNVRHLYVYLDQIDQLNIDEQKRINQLLYARWAINHNQWIRLKINNGNQQWKSWQSYSWRQIVATHDYSERHICEDDI